MTALSHTGQLSALNKPSQAFRVRNPVSLALTVLVHCIVLVGVMLNVGYKAAVIKPPTPLEVTLLQAAPVMSAPPITQPAPPKPTKATPAIQPQVKPEVRPAPVRTEPAPAAITPAPAPPVKQAAEPAPEIKSASPPVAVAAPVKTSVSLDASYVASNPKPPYPAMARRLGEEGTVFMRVLVSAEGLADKVELKKTSGSQILDQAALDTIKKWKFNPARIDGKPVAEWYETRWTFKLES